MEDKGVKPKNHLGQEEKYREKCRIWAHNWYVNNKEKSNNMSKEYRKKHLEELKNKEKNKRLLNPEKYNEKSKKYYRNHREEIKLKSKKYNDIHKEEVKLRRKKYNEKNRVPRLEVEKTRRRVAKLEAFNHYTNNNIKCLDCGKNDIRVLQIHHMNNDGAKHRKEMNSGNASLWLKKYNFPEGYQILCANCHLLKHREIEEGGDKN